MVGQGSQFIESFLTTQIVYDRGHRRNFVHHLQTFLKCAHNEYIAINCAYNEYNAMYCAHNEYNAMYCVHNECVTVCDNK